MDPDISKWPLIYQIMAYAGAAITGILMYLRGSRSRPSDNSAEIERLRQERQQDRDHKVDGDISHLREDTAKVIKAINESIDMRFHEMAEDIRGLCADVASLKTKVAILEDRQSRRR